MLEQILVLIMGIAGIAGSLFAVKMQGDRYDRIRREDLRLEERRQTEERARAAHDNEIRKIEESLKKVGDLHTAIHQTLKVVDANSIIFEIGPEMIPNISSVIFEGALAYSALQLSDENPTLFATLGRTLLGWCSGAPLFRKDSLELDTQYAKLCFQINREMFRAKVST